MNNFADHPIASVYVHHLFALATAARAECDRVFADLPPLPESPQNYIKVDPLLHARIEMVLTSCANIAKLLHVPAHRSKGKTTKAFEWRRARAAALNELLGDAELQELRQTEGRNAVEHFDQLLDRHALECTFPAGARVNVRTAAYNLVVSRRQVFDPFPVPLRVFVVDEATYYAMEETANLQHLRRDLDIVLERLKAALSAQGAEQSRAEPGGLLVYLPFELVRDKP